MNCDTLNDRLLDLLYEEMPEAEAREAQAHVSGCASCQEAFQGLHVTHRLLSVLPEEEPSRSIDAAILAAARQKVGAEPARAERREIDGGGMWASILQWLTGFAGSPQFVMATVMMLVVAVGLWYLPSSRHEPTATGGTVVAPDTRGEAAPSAQLSPAEPLELDLDERTGRIRSRDESGATLAEQQGPAGRGLSQPTSPDPAAAEAAVGDVADGELADLDEMPAMEMDIGGGESFGADGERAAGAGTRSTARSAPSQPSFADSRRDAVESQGEGRAPADDYAAPYRQQTQQPRPSVPAGGAAGADMGSAPSAPASPETEVPAPNREEMMPEAIHRRAQNYARANACQTAISEYRSLLSNYPRYSRRAEAMIELADCQAHLGQLAAAETTLRQVERDYPRAAPAARSRRSRIQTRRRAVDRPAEPASAY